MSKNRIQQEYEQIYSQLIEGEIKKENLDSYVPQIVDYLVKNEKYLKVKEAEELLVIRDYLESQKLELKDVDTKLKECFKKLSKCFENDKFIEYLNSAVKLADQNESTDEVKQVLSNIMENIYSSERNIKFYSKLIEWKDNSLILNDWHKFRNSLYTSLADIILGMGIAGVTNGTETYQVYSNSGQFKWYNNEYTIYVNGRDPKENEKKSSLAEQLDVITTAVYNKNRGKDSKLAPGEKEWEGTLVGEDVAIDISIIWDRNIWKSTAHLAEQGKFRGRFVTHAEVYTAIYSSMLAAINTGIDLKGSTKAATEEYFKDHNSLGFLNRIQIN